MNFNKRIPAVLAVVVLAFAIAQPAFAQSSAQLQGYNNQAGQVQDDVSGNQAPQNASGEAPGAGSAPTSVTGADTGGGGGAQETAGNGLPFTGFDAALLLAAATVLLALGLGLRRLAGTPQAS